jgi:hypothetical protein
MTHTLAGYGISLFCIFLFFFFVFFIRCASLCECYSSAERGDGLHRDFLGPGHQVFFFCSASKPMLYSMPYSTTSWSMMMMMGSRVSSSSGVIITHMHMQREIIVRVSVEKPKVLFILFFPFLGPFVCNYVVFFIIIITLRVFVMYSFFFNNNKIELQSFLFSFYHSR